MPSSGPSWPYLAVFAYVACSVMGVALGLVSLAGWNLVGAAFWAGIAFLGGWLAAAVWRDARGWGD